jgi:glycosyltransferase involved in cell wall biosynthesis
VSRPEISVVMPFAGDHEAGAAAVETLLALSRDAGDELILADNSGTAQAVPGVTVVRAAAERSPAHARNVGAQRAGNDWILFLDADCQAPRELLDAYFSEPVAHDVGALAGEVAPALGGDTLAARYGASRSFLSQQAHLAHPFRPRAVAANLLVRRAAFEAVGGFYEGVRAAEDTDFSWRLQQAGWRLELRPAAFVEHRYRTTIGELRRQWRGYAAGRAWLARRYDGFEPEPALRRVVGRVRRRILRVPVSLRGARWVPASRGDVERVRAGASEVERVGARRSDSRPSRAGRLERASYLVIDALLSAEELAGLALSNRAARPRRDRAGAGVVLIAGRFPAHRDPRVELARTLEGARVEAAARPDAPDVEVARELRIDYREDDGAAARALALILLANRHPLRCALDRARRKPGQPKLAALAPAVLRLEREPRARVLAIGAEETRATATRIARLAGRRLAEPPESARWRGDLALRARRR